MPFGRFFLSALIGALAAVFSSGIAAAKADERPNVVLILADDMGYGDIGVHGCRDIPTPHLDSIARAGVRCTSGYVSAPQCSPTRAGLLTGRYQQRFGHEHNSSHEGSALPLSETTLAERMKAAGYATGLVGKWHLGLGEKHHPLERGFDEFYGFVGGANPYLPRGPKGTVPRILRGHEEADEKEYLTTALGREAAAFVGRHHEQPFFLYLAFNAPHGPLEAPEEYLDRFRTIQDEKRRTYAAMVAAMDDAIGVVLQKLRSLQLEDETLVIFLNDNGGPTDVNASSNKPLRGVKGEVREGGIRIPFFVQWKAKLPAGQTFEHPVIQLDIAPTVLAAAGIDAGSDAKFDGVNLLPYLSGGQSGAPHDVLFWRFSFPPGQPTRYKWAARQGDWKLFSDIDANRKSKSGAAASRDGIALVDLSRDIAEERDLSQENHDRASELRQAWERWNAELPVTESVETPRRERRP